MLVFYYGTMGSGKSLRLLTKAHNLLEQNISFAILKSAIDTRDGVNTIHSRALVEDKECITINTTTNIFRLVESLQNMAVGLGNKPLTHILVDEAQFLTEKQVEELAALSDRYKLEVDCFGLRTDFKTQLFPGSKRLFEIADELKELEATCACEGKTIFNARIQGGKVVTDGFQIEIGGNEMYKALCRKCYFRAINHPLWDENEEES